MLTLNQLLKRLHSLYVNGSIQEINRIDEDFLQTPYSVAWIHRDYPAYSQLSTEVKMSLLSKVLLGITRIAKIILGANKYKITYLSRDDRQNWFIENPTIFVSMEPLRSPLTQESFYDLVDIMTGQVLHEAGHVREVQGYDPEIDEDRELKILYHLVLDVVHDQILTLEYPGFEGYLLKYRRYLIQKLVMEWGITSKDRIKQLILALRSTVPILIKKTPVKRAYYYMLYQLSHHQSIQELRKINCIQIAKDLYFILYQEKLTRHWNEIDFYSEKLILGYAGPPIKGEDGSYEGGNKGEGSDSEPAAQKNGDSLEPIYSDILQHLPSYSEEIFHLDALYKEVDLAHQKLPQVKVSSGKGVWSHLFMHDIDSKELRKKEGIDTNELETLEKFMEEQLTTEEYHDHEYHYRVSISKPKSNHYAAQYYQEAVEKIRDKIILLRNKLSWANTPIQINQYSLNSGDLDEDALYQAKYSTRLFSKPIVKESRTPKLDLILLVDNSSSMLNHMEAGAPPKYHIARQLSALFVEALSIIQSIAIWIYTYLQEGEKSVEIEEIYAPGPDTVKERIGLIHPRGKTPEFEALYTISSKIRQEGRAGVKKIFLILSDGQPDDAIIPAHVQVKKIKNLVKELENEGHVVIHLSLGPEACSRELYTHSIPYPTHGYSDLIQQFSQLLIRLIEK